MVATLSNPANNDDVRQQFNNPERSLAESSADAQLLLSFIRVATIRAKLAAVDLDSIGIALTQGLISLDDAVAWLDDIGLFEIVVPRRDTSEGGRQ
jgi:hypothetical protein